MAAQNLMTRETAVEEEDRLHLFSTSAQLHQAGAMELLLSKYAIADCEEVSSFISRVPEVADVLQSALSPVYEIFGTNTTLSLRVSSDQNSSDDESLSVMIQTMDKIDEAVNKRSRFYRSWWMANRKPVKAMLHFDVDCTGKNTSSLSK